MKGNKIIYSVFRMSHGLITGAYCDMYGQIMGLIAICNDIEAQWRIIFPLRANRSPSSTKTRRVHAHAYNYIILPRAQLDSPEHITSNACDTNNSIDFAVPFTLMLIDTNPLRKCTIH